MDAADLVLMPWDDARRALGDREHAMHVLAPPYPAEGEGILRVLRIRDDGGPLDVTCGFERYRRTGAA
jgi:hypothetical protein